MVLAKQTQIQFRSSPYEVPGTQLSKLVQTTSVADYEVQFQLLATRIYGLSENFQMGCFINGLKYENFLMGCFITNGVAIYTETI